MKLNRRQSGCERQKLAIAPEMHLTLCTKKANVRLSARKKSIYLSPVIPKNAGEEECFYVNVDVEVTH